MFLKISPEEKALWKTLAEKHVTFDHWISAYLHYVCLRGQGIRGHGKDPGPQRDRAAAQPQPSGVPGLFSATAARGKAGFAQGGASSVSGVRQASRLLPLYPCGAAEHVAFGGPAQTPQRLLSASPLLRALSLGLRPALL